MTGVRQILIGLTVLLSGPAIGKSSVEYFYRAANPYINHDFENARKITEEGLSRYPSDERLLALLEKLKEAEKDSENTEEQEGEQNQDGEQNEDRDESDSSDREESENSDSQEKDQGDDAEEDSGNREPGDDQRDGASPKDQDPAEQRSGPGQLTPEEAARLLDALKGREADAQKRRRIRLQGKRYVGNEW